MKITKAHIEHVVAELRKQAIQTEYVVHINDYTAQAVLADYGVTYEKGRKSYEGMGITFIVDDNVKPQSMLAYKDVRVCG